MSGKLYIAAAGSGKTRKIINDSISTDKNVLILTYTITNEQQIISRIKEQMGIVPTNITICTWFSFLLKDGIRPYQGSRFKDRIDGIIFVNGQNNTYVKKTSNKYFESNNKIYTDKLSDCVIELNEKSDGKVFERISKMYDYIYVDEVQDMVGYDLEILKRLIATKTKVIMVGDPRQCTYSTHFERKYKKYGCGKIDEFLKNECKKLDIVIDEGTLSCTHRNNNLICEFANSLYPDRTPVGFIHKADDESKGVKIIDPKDVDFYLENNQAVQLRESVKIKVNNNYPCYNFGESKGLEFERVLIYPTNPMWNWIIDNSSELKEQSRARFYVAVTRAIDSVVIVRKDKRICDLPIIKF
ncbi:UvrD-helicase domain-containing protein [Aminobacterium mobile]|uniref:UvrD-helicase domain-containing protein n=1 Tax=Aminobacterium mobile TaxID=81467 RepID=UPI000466A4E4|nr:UvrD-helicase domain-containing protein [Aminobacterium mobile]